MNTAYTMIALTVGLFALGAALMLLTDGSTPPGASDSSNELDMDGASNCVRLGGNNLLLSGAYRYLTLNNGLSVILRSCEDDSSVSENVTHTFPDVL